MTVHSEKDLLALQRIGRIVAEAREEMLGAVKPGITTRELDDIGAACLARHGARSAPRLAYDFPGVTCISINDEAAHGIPGDRLVRPGDLVNVDVSAELNGCFADTGATVPVAPVSDVSKKLCEATRAALEQAIAEARAGRALSVIGRAVETVARRTGFTILRNLNGHGVGHGIHEAPEAIRNYYEPRDKRRLTDGLVITIEPFLSTGAHTTTTADDGWTLRTPNGALSCQYEHTIVVTRGKPIVITAA